MNTIRIDPVTVASQTDLAARLTLAKDFTRDFSLIYSQYLNSAEAQTWIASYKPCPNFVLSGINDADQNEVHDGYEARHSVGRQGPTGRSARGLGTKRRCGMLLSRDPAYRKKTFASTLPSKGSPSGFYRVNQDVRNLRRFLASQGFPSARIETQQNTTIAR